MTSHSDLNADGHPSKKIVGLHSGKMLVQDTPDYAPHLWNNITAAKNQAISSNMKQKKQLLNRVGSAVGARPGALGNPLIQHQSNA